MLSLSQDGVVHPLEVNLNTQQSCNLNISEAHGGDDGQAAGEEDDDIDKSSSDFEIDRGDYRGIKMSYKAWKRGEENIGNEEERDAVEDRPQFEGDSDVSEFWQEEKEADSGEERVVAKGRPEKLKPVGRVAVNPGPTSRAHNQPEIPKFQDFVPEPNEFCSPGDVGISDSDGEVPRLPLLEGRED